MTMGLMIAVSRHDMQKRACRGDREWRMEWLVSGWMLGRRIWGKRLGIIGMAGSELLWRAGRGHSGCRSTTTTASGSIPLRKRAPAQSIRESLDQMLARMDIISVNCPHTPATAFHLLSARRLALMQPNAL
ncbi:MAG: NAD(P)-dependent oxidoreductase [Nitratireductor sp.]